MAPPKTAEIPTLHKVSKTLPKSQYIGISPGLLGIVVPPRYVCGAPRRGWPQLHRCDPSASALAGVSLQGARRALRLVNPVARASTARRLVHPCSAYPPQLPCEPVSARARNKSLKALPPSAEHLSGQLNLGASALVRKASRAGAEVRSEPWRTRAGDQDGVRHDEPRRRVCVHRRRFRHRPRGRFTYTLAGGGTLGMSCDRAPFRPPHEPST